MQTNYQFIERPVNNLKDLGYVNSEGLDLYQYQKNSGNRDMSNINKNRLEQPHSQGIIKNALFEERRVLINDLIKLLPEINQQYGATLSTDDIDRLRFVPNSRFAYLNRLIKKVLSGDVKSTIKDIALIDTIWMSPEVKASIKKMLLLNHDPNSQEYSIEPIFSKSNLKGISGNKVVLANPGTMYYDTNKNYDDEPNMSVFDTKAVESIISTINERITKLLDEVQLTNELSPIYDPQVVGIDTSVSKSLVYLRDKLLDRHFTLKDLEILSGTINKYLGFRRSKYLLSLSRPFEHKSARIPTLLSPPTATFSIRSIAPLTTNALGNVAFVFMPYGLFTTNYGVFAINNDVTLTGLASSNFFLGVSTGAQLPAPFYTRYRLVSSALKIYCYPSSNNDNGILTVGTAFDTVSPTIVPGTMNNTSQYGQFSLIENTYFKKTITIASREVQEHCYIPVDESYWDFQAVGQPKGDFYWVGYITGAAPSSTIARAEFITNFEAIVDNEYVDYMPSESPMEQVDPKYIFEAINIAKRDNINITSSTIENAFAAVNRGITPDTEIKIPPSKTLVDSNKSIINQDISVVKTLVSDTLQKLNPDKRTDWLAKIFQTVSPILGSMITSFASKINPFAILGKLY